MDDEDDAIVEEIPVFLSKTLQDNLYLFQYPTKSALTNHDNTKIVNCCVKPINQEIKVDFGLDIDDTHYDRYKGEQFAIAADGKTHTKNERPTFKRGIMDKQSFTSSRTISDTNKYIVGIYADKEIHIAPLTSIVQMRPTFSHFDKDDKRKKAEEKLLNDEEDDEDVQQVTVKFAQSGSHARKLKERPTYDSNKQSADEPWCETYWHSRTSPTAELERQKLYATNQEPMEALTLDPNKYLEKLMPIVEDLLKAETSSSMSIVNKSTLRKLPLFEQLRIILKDAKMLSFPEIMTLLTEQLDAQVTTEKVLRTLPQVGILLHGNWVPQSEILYTANTLSNSNGVPAELMVRARDYIIYRFSRTPYLYRSQVISSTQLPPDETLEVLQTIAHLNTAKSWELLLPPDKDFEQRNPELVQRQEMVWRATEQTYNDMDYEKSPKRVRKRSIRENKQQQKEEQT